MSLGIPENVDGAGTGRRLVPMQVGDATVYVEATADDPVVEAVGGLEAVGFDPHQAFSQAGDSLRECVKVVGDRLGELGDAIKPAEVGVEFTISFDVEGTARIVPVLLTGKAKTAAGIKVTALWRAQEKKPEGGGGAPPA